MEVIIAQVEQLSLWWETMRDFGMTLTLTGGVLGFSLRGGRSKLRVTNKDKCRRLA